MRANGFWLSAKGFFFYQFNNLGVGTKKLQGSFVLDFNYMHVGFNEPSDAKYLGSTKELHDENT